MSTRFDDGTDATHAASPPQERTVSASPFCYLASSEEVTRYQHPQFRSLELLLPASLWSDSYLQARARYTLTAQQPADVPARDDDALHKRKERRFQPSWSFMSIYRNYKRARERACPDDDLCEAASRPCTETTACAFDRNGEDENACPKLHKDALVMEDRTSVVPHTTRDERTLEKCHSVSRRLSCSPCDSKHAPSDADSLHGLSTSSHDEGDASLSASTVGSSGCVTPTRCSSLRSNGSVGFDANSSSAHSTTPFLSFRTPHRDALLVFARALERVAAVHTTQCPLCSPTRPPRWGRCATPSSPTLTTHGSAVETPAVVVIHSEKDFVAVMKDSTTESENAQRSEIGCAAVGSVVKPFDACRLDDLTDATSDAALAVCRDEMCQRARELLRRHDARLRHLWETKPVMFREKVAAHPLAQACAQLGGLPLLRALAGTL